jgi:lipid-binding SYLF domain-containing protein
MFKRTLVMLAAAITVVGFTGCTTTMPEKPMADTSAKRADLNAGADKVLADLYKQVPGSRFMVSKAKGVLVFPNVVAAGLGVGASYGEGVLRKDDRPTAYYNTAGGSIGLIAGAQSKAVFMLFMTSESLAKFESSKGWTAGADASVVVLNASASAAVDTKTIQEPIVGYVLSNGGLMANATIDGTKITKLDM